MPWTPSDAERHNKGLSPKEQERWAAIANRTLKACLARGGTDCEGLAIRTANGVLKRDR